jgi:GAF domain-containing protein
MSSGNSDSEKRRLNVLWQYDVLDTIPEVLFDDLTELASGICEAPIALISLVDEKRQWFKSRFGTTLTETSRDVSFCSHAIQQPDLFIIPDTAKDPRFASNPLVTSDPKIRFYAGAPLTTADGYALGTLCVIDKVPRELREQQKQALRILARHVVSQLELRRRSKQASSVPARQPAEDTSALKRQVTRLKAELTKTRRQLAQRTAKKTPASKTRSKRLSRSRR